MKQILFFASLFFLSGCSSSNPDACTCGQELTKPSTEQDAAIMEACAKKSEKLSDKQKVKWFNEVMNCVE
jgi:hypothetical protein